MSSTPDDTIRADLRKCQEKLHTWGRAHQVEFDASKESEHILATCGRGVGKNFKLLGAVFDVGLIMADCISDLVSSCSWKIASILRTRRYFPISDLISIYKTKILSFIEARTPAIYHACSTHLQKLDAVQTRFLRDLGLSEKQALINFNLAPLSTRRDVAMMGLIHRTVLGKGPPHFREFFRPAPPGRERQQTRRSCLRHNQQLQQIQNNARPYLEIMKRSALGLASVYNLLPQCFVDAETVSKFQSKLQALVKHRAQTGADDWAQTFSPRLEMWRHPLHRIH